MSGQKVTDSLLLEIYACVLRTPQQRPPRQKSYHGIHGRRRIRSVLN